MTHAASVARKVTGQMIHTAPSSFEFGIAFFDWRIAVAFEGGSGDYRYIEDFSTVSLVWVH